MREIQPAINGKLYKNRKGHKIRIKRYRNHYETRHYGENIRDY